MFDLDGTLAESKSEMDAEMSSLLVELLKRTQVAVISGASYEQVQKQFLTRLDCPEQLKKRLFLFPTCGTQFIRFDKEWKPAYQKMLSPEQKQRIMDAFALAMKETNFSAPMSFGKIIEDRGTQITFSGMGQKAPLEFKKQWDPDQKKRQAMRTLMIPLLPDCEVRLGGSTSIDVTRKGIDKQYGIKQMIKHLSVQPEEILFVGDALYEGGNDWPVKEAGVRCKKVSGPEETKAVIRTLL